MKIATRNTSFSDSSPASTDSNLCSVAKDSGCSIASGYHGPVNLSDSILSLFFSSFDGLLPVALSLLTNITWPSAGETSTPPSLGIFRSGSRQKLAKKAAIIQHSTPNK